MILRQAIATRQPIPKKIAEAPELRPGLELYYMAFFELASTRTGFGDGPIPWTAVAEYARVYEFDTDQLEQLAYYVARMDDVFVRHVRAKQAGKNPPPPRGK